MSTRRFSLIFSLLLAQQLFAQTTTPTLTSVTPRAVLAGSGDTQVTVKGGGFSSSAIVSVLVNNPTIQNPLSENLPTTFIDSSTVQAVVPAAFLANSQLLLVRVSNEGPPGAFGLSMAVESTSPPVVTFIDPAGAAPGLFVTLNVHGANLIGGSVSIAGGGGITQGGGPSSFLADLLGAFLVIAPDAPLGPRSVTVSTLSGSTTTCGANPCTFTVVNAGTWTDVTPSTLPSFAPGPLVKLLDGRVLMIGGATQQPGGPATPVSSAEIFDPATQKWSATGSMSNSRAMAAASLLPDGRVLVVGGSASSTAFPGEIYDPVSGTWSTTATMTSPIASKALLLPNGQVLVSYGTTTFAAELFDPVSGTFQVLSNVAFPTSGSASTELLPDGRVFLVGTALQSRIYDPATGIVSTAAAGEPGNTAENTKLLPDGRVLVEGITNTGVSALPFWGAYNPTANSFQQLPSILAVGSEVLLPDGSVLISGETLGSTGTFLSSAARYDPVHDQLFLEPSATRPAAPSLLLDDGRAFGIEYRYSAQDSTNSGTFAQTYTPPSYSNPTPVVSSVVTNNASGSQILALDVHGISFLPNSVVSLAGNTLVTLYLGSQHLVAFVPAALRSFLSSGISVNNPGPGGGSTAPLPAGYTASVPLPIPDVETGSIHTGYVVVTGDLGSAPPVATLTYGSVSGGIVQSQAAVLPAPLTAATSMAVDVVPGIGRNLGIAIANAAGNSALITLTLHDLDGNLVGTQVALSIPAGGQIARFISELLPAASLGSAFRGSISFQSSIPVSFIGLRFSGTQFSTVPIPVTNPAAVPANGAVGGPNATMFPQFAMSGGWATALDLVNNTSGSISGRVDIFDSNGNPLAILWNGSRQSTFTYSIPPNGAIGLSPRDANGQTPF
jgi:hypothetical protein